MFRVLVEVEHVCVECGAWHTTLEHSDCPGAALLANAWATEAELNNIEAIRHEGESIPVL